MKIVFIFITIFLIGTGCVNAQNDEIPNQDTKDELAKTEGYTTPIVQNEKNTDDWIWLKWMALIGSALAIPSVFIKVVYDFSFR